MQELKTAFYGRHQRDGTERQKEKLNGVTHERKGTFYGVTHERKGKFYGVTHERKGKFYGVTHERSLAVWAYGSIDH